MVVQETKRSQVLSQDTGSAQHRSVVAQECALVEKQNRKDSSPIPAHRRRSGRTNTKGLGIFPISFDHTPCACACTHCCYGKQRLIICNFFFSRAVSGGGVLIGQSVGGGCDGRRGDAKDQASGAANVLAGESESGNGMECRLLAVASFSWFPVLLCIS